MNERIFEIGEIGIVASTQSYRRYIGSEALVIDVSLYRDPKSKTVRAAFYRVILVDGTEACLLPHSLQRTRQPIKHSGERFIFEMFNPLTA